MRQVVVIGNPGHKRLASFQDALADRGWPRADVVSWLEVCECTDRLAELAAGGAFLRLESPGQSFEVDKQFLILGAEEGEECDCMAARISAEEANALPYEKGRLYFPRQWYRGFRAVLRSLARIDGRWLNHPSEVIDLFDKRICQARLAEAGVPIPQPIGPARSYEELLSRMHATGRSRAFIKLASGSSGAGVVAFAMGGARQMAITSAELVCSSGRGLIYNSRRVQRYDKLHDIRMLLDTLCAEGVQVEEWIPKARLHGQLCDLRVLIVAGTEKQMIARLSNTPFTNLHLLNQRADAAELAALVPQERWAAALQNCRVAAQAFPGMLHIGIDLAFTSGFRKHVVFEANAFGDLLPGVLWNGMESYAAELCVLEHHEVQL